MSKGKSFEEFSAEDYNQIIIENNELKATNRRILKSLEKAKQKKIDLWMKIVEVCCQQ